MQIQNMVSLNVEDNISFFLIVYDNREVELVTQSDLDNKVHNFKFVSHYKKPKNLSDYPIH